MLLFGWNHPPAIICHLWRRQRVTPGHQRAEKFKISFFHLLKISNLHNPAEKCLGGHLKAMT